MNRAFFINAALLGGLIGHIPPVSAQMRDDVVVMRRVIASPAKDLGQKFLAITGEWSDWSTLCGYDAKRTRTNTCLRQPGDVEVEAAKCGIESLETEEDDVFTECTGTWKMTYGSCVGGSQAPIATCTGTGSCDPRSIPEEPARTCYMTDSMDDANGWLEYSTTTRGTNNPAEGAAYLAFGRLGNRMGEIETKDGIPVKAGVATTVTMQARAGSTVACSLSILVRNGTRTQITRSFSVAGPNWREVSLSWMPNSTPQKILLSVDNCASLHVDDFSVR